MHQGQRVIACVTSISLGVCSATALAFGAGTAASNGSKIVALSANLKRCDFSNIYGVPPATRGTGYAIITRTGGTLAAEAHLLNAAPDTPYGVRVVEMPRS